jgi:outer membrane protein assembly factor BamB
MSKLFKPSSPVTFALLAVFLAVILSSCSGGALAGSSWPGVTIRGETGYVAYGPHVYAVDLATGNELWRFPSEPDRALTFYAPVAYASNDLIIVGGYDKLVYALAPDGRNVNIAWTFEGSTDNIVGGPVVVDQIVLIPSSDGNLYALDIDTGELVWDEPFSARAALWSSPIIDEDRIYLGSLAHYLYALELSSGALIWEADLGAAIADSPTLSNGYLLVGTFGQEVDAVDVETGEIAWTFEAEGSVWGNPSVSGEVAFVGDVTGLVYAVNLEDGSEIWHQRLDGAVAASPMVTDGVVYVVTEIGLVYQLDASDGTILWDDIPNLDGRLLADPVIFEGELLLPTLENSECLIFGVGIESSRTSCLFDVAN